MLVKYWAVTLVWKVEAQASSVEFRKCLEMASAEEESGSPFLAVKKRIGKIA
jgi:hypothetical protein